MRLTRASLLVALAGLSLCASRPVRAEVSDSEVKRLLGLLRTDDGHARLVAFAELERVTPPAERADVLSRAWSAAGRGRKGSPARGSVLAYLASRPPDEMPWSDRLEDQVFRAAGDEDATLRRLALGVLVRRDAPAARERVLRYLEDPDDELRELALTYMRRWPDRAAIFTRYVERNRGVKGRERSVSKALFLLEKAPAKGAE